MARALVLIDIQNAIFELPAPLFKPDDFLSNVVELLEKARKEGVSIVFIQNASETGTRFERGTAAWQIHAAIRPAKGEIVIEKKHPDSFQETNLDQILRERNIHFIYCCGFASQYCLDTTVRAAFGRGYSVTLASDAHTTTSDPILSAEQIVDHENFVLKRFSNVQPVREITLI